MTDPYETQLLQTFGFVFGEHVELELQESKNPHMRLVGTTLVPRSTIQKWLTRSWAAIEVDGDRKFARLTKSGEAAARERWMK